MPNSTGPKLLDLGRNGQEPIDFPIDEQGILCRVTLIENTGGKSNRPRAFRLTCGILSLEVSVHCCTENGDEISRSFRPEPSPSWVQGAAQRHVDTLAIRSRCFNGWGRATAGAVPEWDVERNETRI